MKRTHARTRRLKTAVSVYNPSKHLRPDHCARKGRRSRVSWCLGGAAGVELVGVWEERRTIITALLELGIQRFSLSRFLCCLFAL